MAPDSVINNVQFVNADATLGSYSERPFVDFSDTVIGDFTRTLDGNEAWFAFTGSFTRDDRNVTTGFVISANEDASNIVMNANRAIGGDGNVNLWLVNFYLPQLNGNNIQFFRRQASGTAGGGDDSTTIVLGTGWNPAYTDSDGVTSNDWRFFTSATIYPLPDTKLNTPGANDVPAAITIPAEGQVLSALTNRNGFVIEQNNINTISETGSNLITQNYASENVRIYDFKTQVGNEIGTQITLTGPPQGETRASWIEAATTDEERTFRQLALQEMFKTGTAINWRHQDARTFTTDPNIPTVLTEAQAEAAEAATRANFENVYGIFKSYYNRNNLSDTDVWPLGDTPGSISIDRDALWSTRSELSSTQIQVYPNSLSNALTADAVVNTWNTNTFETDLNFFILPSGITLAGATGGVYEHYANQTSNTDVAFRGTFTINLSARAGTYNINDVLGNYTITGDDSVTITADNVITLTGTSDQGNDFTFGSGVTFQEAVVPVTFAAALQQSAPFGTDAVNFNGYVTVVRNSGGTRTIEQGPTLITDINRATFALTGNYTSANLGSDIIEIVTTGDQWSLSRATITSSSAAVTTIGIIADPLYQRGVDLNGTVGTVTGTASTLAVPVTGTGSINGVGEANRFVGSIRSTEQYARTVSLGGNATDIIRFEASTVPPIVDTSIVTLSSGDSDQQSIPGLVTVGGGTLATTATISAPTVVIGAAPTGLQGSDVVQAIDNSTLGATINDTNDQITNLSVLDRL